MTDYRNFQVDDFLEDPLFLDWIFENDKIAKHFWKEWLQLNPDKQYVIQEARNVLLGNKRYRPDGLPDSLDDLLMPTQTNYPSLQSTNRSFKHTLIGVAVFMVLASGLGLFFIDKHTLYAAHDFATSYSILPPRFITTVNTQDTSTIIQLPDGSTVELQPGSELSYPVAFLKDEREVFLNGTAYFTVSKEEQERKFCIITPTMNATTSYGEFKIAQVEEDDSITIDVDSGDVHVSSSRNFFTDRLYAFFSGKSYLDTTLTASQTAIINNIENILTIIKP